MNRHRVRPLITALVLLTFVAPATVSAVVRRVPEDFASIPAAIAACAAGDSVLVGPGKWVGFVAFTDTKGDSVILRSVAGPEKTTIVYGDSADVNQAVVTFQRCSPATRLVGFSIDGRSVARYGVLVTSDSKPQLDSLAVSGCEFGVACVRGGAPSMRDVAARESHTAGLYIVAGSADVVRGRFDAGDKFGIYVGATSAAVRLADVHASDNKQSGVQLVGGDVAFDGGTVEKNGDVGVLVQGTSPKISGVTVAEQKGVGVVFERSDAVLENCSIRGNEFGAVSSIDGSPHIVRCTFADNRKYHVGVEGAASPVVGGSLADANRFLGNPAARLQTSSSAKVNATFNYWEGPCAPDSLFRKTGAGELALSPWASADLVQSFGNCDSARAYVPPPVAPSAPPPKIAVPKAVVPKGVVVLPKATAAKTPPPNASTPAPDTTHVAPVPATPHMTPPATPPDTTRVPPARDSTHVTPAPDTTRFKAPPDTTHVRPAPVDSTKKPG